MSSKSNFCASCGVFGPTHRHHMVPQVMGGTDLPTVELCVPCHGAVHGKAWSVDHHELTRIGLAAAKARGVALGNPRLRAGDPEMIRKIRLSRDAAHRTAILSKMDIWLPIVERMRPSESWVRVAAEVSRALRQTWTVERLRRTMHRLVKEGSVDARLMGRAEPRYTSNPIVEAVAFMVASYPGDTLADIGERLISAGYSPPRGGVWYSSSVKHLLQRADAAGLIDMDAFTSHEIATSAPRKAVVAKPAAQQRYGYGPRRLTKGRAAAVQPTQPTPTINHLAAVRARRQSPQLQFAF